LVNGALPKNKGKLRVAARLISFAKDRQQFVERAKTTPRARADHVDHTGKAVRCASAAAVKTNHKDFGECHRTSHQTRERRLAVGWVRIGYKSVKWLVARREFGGFAAVVDCWVTAVMYRALSLRDVVRPNPTYTLRWTPATEAGGRCNA
jgi:hypothetical protein